MTVTEKRIESRPHSWRVNECGEGKTIVLLHGAGASSDSWLDVARILADRFRVIAPDLPGHGGTRLGMRTRSGLDSMAEDVLRLLQSLNAIPDLVVGHSAGAAVALRMAETSTIKRVVGFNAALAQFPGLAGVLFPALAQVLSLSPGVGEMVAIAAGRRNSTRNLLATTGGPIADAMVDRYHRLITNPAHVKATLSMMAQWRIEPLVRAMPSIDADVRLVVGGADATVPPDTSYKSAQRLKSASVIARADLGHLAHEQDPVWAADLIADFATTTA